MLPKGGGRTKHITLIDPDKQSPEVAAQRALVAVECGTSAIFVGGSTDTGSNIVDATCGAIQEALEHDHEGLIFEPGNTDRITESIMQLQCSPEKVLKMGLAARKRAAREHSWEKNGQGIIKLYRQINSRILATR